MLKLLDFTQYEMKLLERVYKVLEIHDIPIMKACKLVGVCTDTSALFIFNLYKRAEARNR